MADSAQRGSDRTGPLRDEEAKKEMEGRLRSSHPTRAEEWDDVEPGADDDPPVAEGPVPAPGGRSTREAEDERLRSDLARHLGRTSFPADRAALEGVLREAHAPDGLVNTVQDLPRGGHRYANVQEVMAALGREPEA